MAVSQHSMPVDSTRTAPAGPGSPCDWLKVPLRVTLAPSVALTTTKPAKNARPGSWFCQAGWGGDFPLRNRPDDTGQGARSDDPRVLRACSHSSPAFLFLGIFTLPQLASRRAPVVGPRRSCSRLQSRRSTSCVKLCHPYAELNVDRSSGDEMERADESPLQR